jgi:hypothetical protein
MAICPACKSHRILRRQRAGPFLGFLGALAGVAWAASLGVRWVSPFPQSPPYPSSSSVGTVLIAAFCGMAGGCAIGEFIDRHLLGCLRCFDCGAAYEPVGEFDT